MGNTYTVCGTFFSIPSLLRWYQKVTWKHWRRLIGQRQALLPPPKLCHCLNSQVFPKLSWFFSSLLSCYLFLVKQILCPCSKKKPHPKKQERQSCDILHCSYVCLQFHDSFMRCYYDDQKHWVLVENLPVTKVSGVKLSLLWNSAKNMHDSLLMSLLKFPFFLDMSLYVEKIIMSPTCKDNYRNLFPFLCQTTLEKH